jgi:hypothetical protein
MKIIKDLVKKPVKQEPIDTFLVIFSWSLVIFTICAMLLTMIK